MPSRYIDIRFKIKVSPSSSTRKSAQLHPTRHYWLGQLGTGGQKSQSTVKIILYSNDIKNPLKIFCILYTTYNVKLIDCTLKQYWNTKITKRKLVFFLDTKIKFYGGGTFAVPLVGRAYLTHVGKTGFLKQVKST